MRGRPSGDVPPEYLTKNGGKAAGISRHDCLPVGTDGNILSRLPCRQRLP
jgi:hypothetical protein